MVKATVKLNGGDRPLFTDSDKASTVYTLGRYTGTDNEGMIIIVAGEKYTHGRSLQDYV